MIIYTSGTTGRPKGAVHVHGGFLVKIAQEVAHQVDLHDDDILYWVTDMGWIMGPWEIVGGLPWEARSFSMRAPPTTPR
jgi:acetyl-CoA synthetase